VTVEKELKERFSIKSFPTLKFLQAGETNSDEAIEFFGLRIFAHLE